MLLLNRALNVRPRPAHEEPEAAGRPEAAPDTPTRATPTPAERPRDRR